MNTAQKLAYWAPRIYGIILTIFFTLFALDVQYTGDAVAFATELAIHMIPTAVLITILVLAWRREWVGVVAYTALGIWYIIIAHTRPDWIAAITGILFFGAILFSISWYNRRHRLAH